MTFATKYNTGRKFDIDTHGFQYYKLSELFETDPEHVHPLRAIYINESPRYGKSPVFATDTMFVNVPAHMTAMCEQILQDADDIADINAGRVGFKIYTYESHERKCYGVQFVDVPAL